MSFKHKISGFFFALMLAIVSFFVIYFFFPDFSQNNLGYSFKYRNGGFPVSEESFDVPELEQIPDKTNYLIDSVTERLKVKNIIGK